MLNLVKIALRINTNVYDTELTMLINAAIMDLGIAGVVLPASLDAICEQAVITYCKLHFGNPDNADKLQRSYDEQKAQLATATNYTNWSA